MTFVINRLSVSQYLACENHVKETLWSQHAAVIDQPNDEVSSLFSNVSLVTSSFNDGNWENHAPQDRQD